MEDLNQKMNRMNEVTDDLTGANEGQKQSNSEMTEAAKGMGKLPAEIYQAVLGGMSRMGVTLDGDVLVGYVNNRQATNIGP